MFWSGKQPPTASSQQNGMLGRVLAEYQEGDGLETGSGAGSVSSPGSGYRVRGRQRREDLARMARVGSRGDRVLRSFVLRDETRQTCRKHTSPLAGI